MMKVIDMRATTFATLCILGLSVSPLALATAAHAQENPLVQSPSAPAQTPPAAAHPEDKDGEAAAAPLTATDIIRSLAPMAGGNPNASDDTRPVDVGPRRKIRVDYSHAIDMTVFFKYDSAVLTPEAQAQLEPLGRALQSHELAPYRFLIAGHTDAAGEAGYNVVLSHRRAQAVRLYLIAVYGIDPSRLLTIGWGSDHLKDPTHPLSGINRRVEVALILPARDSSNARDYDPDWDVLGALSPPDVDMRTGEITLRHWEIGPVVMALPSHPRHHLVDPRHFTGYELDDFHAAPTGPCEPDPE